MLARVKNRCKGTVLALFISFTGISANAQESTLLPELDVSTGLPSNTVRVLKLDADGKLWIGTDHGLAVLNNASAQYHQIIKTIGNKSIWGLEVMDSLLFIGTRYDGLYVASFRTGKVKKHFPPSTITQIRRIKAFAGKAFILTNTSVWKWQNETLTEIPFGFVNTNHFVIDVFEWQKQIYGITYPETKVTVYDSAGKSFRLTNIFGVESYFYQSHDGFSAAASNKNIVIGLSAVIDNGVVIVDSSHNITGHRMLKSFKSPYPFWQSQIVGNMLLLAIGDAETNNRGALYTAPLDALEPDVAQQDYVTCFEVDSVQHLIYYGTLNKGLFAKRLSLTTIPNKKRYKAEYLFLEPKKLGNKGIGAGWQDYLRNVLAVGDTLVADFDGHIHLWDNKQHKTIAIIKKEYGKITWNYLQHVEIVKNRLYLFDNYGKVSHYDLKSGEKKTVDSLESFLPYPQQHNGDIILLNREKGFTMIRDSTSFKLSHKEIDLPFIDDYTVSENTIITLSNNYIKTYRIDLHQKALTLIHVAPIANMVNGFIPKWILVRNGKLLLMNPQGILFLNAKTFSPERYFFYGNYANIAKPRFNNDYLIIASDTQEDRIPIGFVEQPPVKVAASSIGLVCPLSIQENLNFTMELQSPSYLITNHTLKTLQIWENEKLVATRYAIGNEFVFPNGLKYGRYRMVVTVGDTAKTINMGVTLPLNRNPYFFGGLAALVILFIGSLAKWIIDRRRLTAKLSENRMQILKQNLNPHFVYNSMNLISSLILEEKYEEAVLVVAEFSQLQRTYLETNNKDAISLSEELNFIKMYLQLQQRRFFMDNDFSYTITIGEQVDVHAIMVPPLILQPLVENAIKHGIIGSAATNKRIHIDVTGKAPMVVSIEDNGEVPLPSEHGLGLGLKIVAERISIFNTTYGRHLQLHPDRAPEHGLRGYRIELNLS